MEHREAETFSEAIGYRFSDAALLENALTHSSFVKGDGRNASHNERLEFLGDAVLELCVSEHLYRRHPDMQEGQMTRARARLVCEEALYVAACALGLPACLRLSRGEERSGGRDKPSIVSDALEAVIGAVYLDGGLEAARGVIIRRVLSLLENARVDAMDRDYKTRLQELVQKDHIGTLRYELVDTAGPEHSKTFTMRVLLSEREIGLGEGSTKQSAGQAAAKNALAVLSARETTL
ncbi:MAG: ribonuclease III [Clostridia bacterium]|nr:ribonuclease III [Clostridia bacterium]